MAYGTRAVGMAALLVSSILSACAPNGIFQARMSDNIERRDLDRGILDLQRATQDSLIWSAAWLQENAHRFPPQYMYLIALRMTEIDPEAAEFWWLAGRLRMHYDVLRCTDESTHDNVARSDFWLRNEATRLGRPVPAAHVEAADYQRALDWDIANPQHGFSILPVCISGIRGMVEALEQGIEPIQTTSPDHVGTVAQLPNPVVEDPRGWIKPMNEHPAILEEARGVFREAMAAAQ